MNPGTFLADAVALAARVHREQRDKAGMPYILHPLRLMLRQESEEAQIVAVLHDVLEDSPDTGAPVTCADLREMGFGEDVVRAIDALTKREGESYDDFIDRLASNPLARQVKMADLEDNMDPRRLASLGGPDLERIAKYHRAWVRLCVAVGRPNGGQ